MKTGMRSRTHRFGTLLSYPQCFENFGLFPKKINGKAEIRTRIYCLRNFRPNPTAETHHITLFLPSWPATMVLQLIGILKTRFPEQFEHLVVLCSERKLRVTVVVEQFSD